MIDTFKINTHLQAIAHKIEFLANPEVSTKLKQTYQENYLNSIQTNLRQIREELKKISDNQVINPS